MPQWDWNPRSQQVSGRRRTPECVSVAFVTQGALFCFVLYWRPWPVWRHWNFRHILIITYLLTPWSRVLLEKLTGSAASQEIPHIFWILMFITVLTNSRHLYLYWANSIQSPQAQPNSRRSILILSPSTSRVSQLVSFPHVSPPEPCVPLSPLSST